MANFPVEYVERICRSKTYLPLAQQHLLLLAPPTAAMDRFYLVFWKARHLPFVIRDEGGARQGVGRRCSALPSGRALGLEHFITQAFYVLVSSSQENAFTPS